MIKVFFKTVRFVLGGIIVSLDKLFPPRPLKRDEEQQIRINNETKQLALYQFTSCPFCIKVRRKSKKLNVPLETRNILQNKQWHQELEQHGGKRKVPCLRIEHNQGNVEWMYESNQINAYLEERFAG